MYGSMVIMRHRARLAHSPEMVALPLHEAGPEPLLAVVPRRRAGGLPSAQLAPQHVPEREDVGPAEMTRTDQASSR